MPVADVLQAAIAEVEDYVRVDVITESADAVAGMAVNDVIHLIAELVENATAFSPPNTRVVISGGVVAHGFAVEIEDRGLGMAPDAMAAVNEHLASPPEFDLANSERLGLFVAGQLAARHGIRVSLRPSPFGGTAAIVLLPRQIIVPENETDTWFGPGSTLKLPAAAANGWAHDAGPTGSRERGPGFAMTGRHQLALSSSSPESGQPDGTELDEPPLAGTGSPFPALPAQAQHGSLMAAADETYLGLPRRVRQASLAPELRGQLGAESARPREAAEPAAHSPEQTGSRMFALQDGWQRGRRDELDYPDIGLDILGGWPAGASGAEAESNDSGGES